jgi:hypothetical protein
MKVLPQLIKPYAANPIGNVTLVDPVPESDLEEFLSAADVWIIPIAVTSPAYPCPAESTNSSRLDAPSTQRSYLGN